MEAFENVGTLNQSDLIRDTDRIPLQSSLPTMKPQHQRYGASDEQRIHRYEKAACNARDRHYPPAVVWQELDKHGLGRHHKQHQHNLDADDAQHEPLLLSHKETNGRIAGREEKVLIATQHTLTARDGCLRLRVCHGYVRHDVEQCSTYGSPPHDGNGADNTRQITKGQETPLRMYMQSRLTCMIANQNPQYGPKTTEEKYDGND